MNIISRIKSWFEPAQIPNKPMVRIRFKNNQIVNVYYRHTDDPLWNGLFAQELECYKMKVDKANGIDRRFGELVGLGV